MAYEKQNSFIPASNSNFAGLFATPSPISTSSSEEYEVKLYNSSI